MQNENKTNAGNVDPHNPQKKGESGAINKLNENEDENADDTCGCGSPHASSTSEPNKGTQGRRLEDRTETDNEDPSANPNRQPATATRQGQDAKSQGRSGPQQGDIANLGGASKQDRPAQQSDQNKRPYDPNMQAGSMNQGQNTQEKNQPGEEMNESEDETAPENRLPSADTRQGDQQQNAQNDPRSRRQLGDPDDELSAETRRKESIAEDAEKADEGNPDVSGAAPKKTIMQK